MGRQMKIVKNFAALFVWMPFFLCCILLASCDAVDIHPYDCDISGERDVNKNNILQISFLTNSKKEIKFVFLSDTQRWYDETEDAVNSIKARDDIDFVIHGGDLSDFGGTKEFLWQRDILNGLDVPYVALIGNHDCLGSGEQAFKAIFGEPNFSFVAANTLFVCLNTNALEFDYSNPVPDFNFIEQLRRNLPDGVNKTVFAMHARPYTDQFNNNVAGVFDHHSRMFPNVQFYLFGHEHSRMEVDLFETGVMYYGISRIKDREYYIFTINEEGYEYEVVEF